MYITKAIETAKTLRPDEFSIDEYIMWCNELSCDLFMNCAKKFSNIVYSGEKEIMLPENVDIYLIDKVIADGRELRKTDAYDFANTYFYSENGRCVLKRPQNVKTVEIVYQIPYEQIRCINVDITIKANEKSFESDDVGIYAGDVLTIRKDGKEYTVCVVSIYDDVYDYSGDTLPSGIYECNIKRKIQEKTVCPPPYDYMYIDFLIAKSCLYSGDSNGYKNHMSAFNLKYEEYKKWISRSRENRIKKFLNWY